MKADGRRSLGLNHTRNTEETTEGMPLSTEQVQATGTERPAEKKPWWKRWWAITLGIFVIVGFIGSLFSDDDEEAETDEAVEAQEAEQQDEDDAEEVAEDEESSQDEEPVEEEPEELDFTIELEEGFGENGEVRVEFDLPDHFTAGLIASQTKRTAAEGLAEARAEYPEADRYYLWINGQQGTASNAGFLPETLDSLDLTDPTLNVFEHLDAGSAHPDLLD